MFQRDWPLGCVNDIYIFLFGSPEKSLDHTLTVRKASTDPAQVANSMAFGTVADNKMMLT
jgi:hypothetical protein